MIINYDNDRFIKEVLDGDEYGYLFKDLTIIDLGCNIGTFSLRMQDKASMIYAIDIGQSNIDQLNKTIQDNKFTNIKTYTLGISGKTGKRGIEKRAGAEIGAWSLNKTEDDSGIMTYTLNEFMLKEKIEFVDVLKIDIEGGEDEVFHAPDFPKTINTIIGERHNLSVVEVLTSKGYRYKEYKHEHFIARKI
jgi:FkbM family methyltransferase